MMEGITSELERFSGLRRTYHCHICCEQCPVGHGSFTLESCGHMVHAEVSCGS